MATNNIKIFDENKGNIMSTQEYSTNAQRLNGVQQGIASSMLQNKTLYQVSLIAYAIGQMMVNNGLDANDDNAVSAFVGNLANTIVQKVVDKASTAEAQAGTDANKFMTPATTRAAINVLKATSGMATTGTDNTHWMTPLLVKQMINSFVPGIVGYSKVYDKTFDVNASKTINVNLLSYFNSSSYNDFIVLFDTTLKYAAGNYNDYRLAIYIQNNNRMFLVSRNVEKLKQNVNYSFVDVCYVKKFNNTLFFNGCYLRDYDELTSFTQISSSDPNLNTFMFQNGFPGSGNTMNLRIRFYARKINIPD